MKVNRTEHTSSISNPDKVFVDEIVDETDGDIILFAVPHSHSKSLNRYWGSNVTRYDGGTAVVSFFKE